MSYQHGEGCPHTCACGLGKGPTIEEVCGSIDFAAPNAPEKPNTEGARSRSPRLHELKTWPDFFQRVVMGEKRFELRKNDRDFHVGDTLRLREYVKALDHYTGREVFADVLYLLAGDWPGLMDGYVVMSIGLKSDV